MNKFHQWLIRFMAGRYGTDKLNMVLLTVAALILFVNTVLQMFIRLPFLSFALALLSWGLTGYAIFRCFSRNTYRRYEENRRFLRLIERFKDRQHRYYDCPRCHQTVRVPRRKGKIAITCPKCQEKFIRKT